MMHPAKPITAIITAAASTGLWATIDGMLGTLAALVAVAAGIAGFIWTVEKIRLTRLDRRIKQRELDNP